MEDDLINLVFIENKKSFECYLNDISKDDKCPEKHSACKRLLKELMALYNSPNEIDSITKFKITFQAFCQSCNDPILIYRLFLRLLDLIGFNIDEYFYPERVTAKYRITDANYSKSLEIVNALFDVLLEIKVKLDCKVNEISFTDFIAKLLKSVMTMARAPNSCIYQILLKTAEINPLIIESIINDILVFVMLSNNVGLENQYETFMAKIVDIFNKLHRIQALVSKLIPTLKSNLVDRRQFSEIEFTFRGETELGPVQDLDCNVDLMLPGTVINCLTGCITTMASWQVMNLFKTLLHHLEIGVAELADVIKEPPKLLYMEILSTLVCWLLSSVRIAEHTVVENTVQKFVGGLNELQVILGKFGTVLLDREHNHVLVKAFLSIAYNWAEIYMILAYYSADRGVQLTRTMDQDFAACNLTYLHPYLTTKQWCLLSERIANFGEKPCKQLMQKLLVQKLKGAMLFDSYLIESMTEPVLQNLSADFDEDIIDIYNDKFVVNSLLPKMPHSFIATLAEVFIQNLISGGSHFHDSQIITRGILCVLVTKIGKCTKQKRKMDESGVRKSLISKMLAKLPADVFLTEFDQFLGKTADVLRTAQEDTPMDININGDKIRSCLDMLKKLPIISCPDNTRKLLVLLLMGLHRDLLQSNCHSSVVDECDSTIIGIMQQSKFTFLDLFDAAELLQLIVTDYKRFDELFLSFAGNIFKTSESIEAFRPGIDHIKTKLDDTKYLKCAVIILNILTKVRRSKMPTETKQLSQEYKTTICNKIVKFVNKTDLSDELVEPFALTARSGYLDTLKNKLTDYSDFCVRNLNPHNLKGALLLFITILHNRNNLKDDFGDDFPLKIWDCLRSVTVTKDIKELYDQFVLIITTSIPNEEFSQITNDLLKFTEQAIGDGNLAEVARILKTWSCILSSNFNPTKTKVLQDEVETLLHKLILLQQNTDYDRELCQEITQFHVSLIQTVQFHVTPVMMDVFILTPTIMMEQTNKFDHIFDCSISILENLLKYRNPLVMDRLSPYLCQYRVLLSQLCVQSNSDLNLERIKVRTVAECAHKLERLTRNLALNHRDMGRIAPYLMADILAQLEKISVYPEVKLHLDNCIYSLISLCDQHAIEFVTRVLSNISTERFKMLYRDYKKDYRFTGKI